MTNFQKVSIGITSLAVVAGSFVAGTQLDGQDVNVEVTYENVQRLWRDYAELERKAAQDAGDDQARQYWLVQRRLAEASISMRELWKDVRDVEPTPDPPPDNPTPDDEHIATLPADAPVGSVGSIGWARQGDKVLAFTSARMQGQGMNAVIQVLDTTVEGWQLIEGNSTQATEELTDAAMLVWFEPTPGTEYEVQAWVNMPDGSKSARSTRRVIVD